MRRLQKLLGFFEHFLKKKSYFRDSLVVKETARRIDPKFNKSVLLSVFGWIKTAQDNIIYLCMGSILQCIILYFQSVKKKIKHTNPITIFTKSFSSVTRTPRRRPAEQPLNGYFIGNIQMYRPLPKLSIRVRIRGYNSICFFGIRYILQHYT